MPEQRGAVLIGTSTCDPSTWTEHKPFYFNNEFTSKSEFFVKGEICFPIVPEFASATDSTYRTVFWSYVDHNGIILANNDVNVKYAFRRMSGLRQPPDDYLPDLPERVRYQVFDTDLKSRQASFIEKNQDFLLRLNSLYSSYFVYYLGMEEECHLHYDDPHVKKRIRVDAYNELLDSKTLFKPLWVRHVLYKLKKDEWARPNKYARMIGDLGVAASLQGFRVTDFMKVAEANEPTVTNGIESQFIKAPNQLVLRQVFEKLIDPPLRGYFCYFSDDSCFSIRVNNVVYRFNIDISSCDASHTPSLFQALRDITPNVAAGDMQRLIDQLKLPIKIRSVSNPKNTVLLYSKDGKPHLYSGSTLTTRINNLANQLISLALSQADFSNCHCYNDVVAVIKAACLNVGYIVTCQIASEYSHVQFLKHSPVYDVNGRLQPLLNLGVLLRSSGICHRDLPGRGDIQERGRLFQRALLTGIYSNVSFPLIDRMRLSVVGASPSIRDQKWIDHMLQPLLQYKVCDNVEPFQVSFEESFRRYSHLSTQYDFAELMQDYGDGSFGTVVANVAANSILTMDYSLGCSKI